MENSQYVPDGKERPNFTDEGSTVEIAMFYDMGFGLTTDSLDEKEVQELVYFLQGWLDRVRKDKLNVRG